MTIAFITSEYPHKELKPSAGLGSSIKNLASGLVDNGINVIILAVFQNNNGTINDNGIKIISIARKGYPFFGWYLERKNIEKCVKREIKNSAIDVIEAPDWTGITAFMNFKVPLVIRLHGSDAYFCKLEGRKQKKKHFFFEKNALKKADAIVAVSNFVGKETKDIFNLTTDIVTIYNGINIESFKPAQKGVNKGTILYFGSVIRKKGVLELASVFNTLIEKNTNLSLLILGKDTIDVFEKCSTLLLIDKILTEKARENTSHIEEVPYTEIQNYLVAAHVVVLPSFAEAFPMTWLESLAMEKPLVTSNIGWASELMVHNKTGLTVNPKNHTAFAEAIEILLDNHEKSIQFGKNGRKHVAKYFSTSTILNQNIDFYSSLITK